jgi:hypothetical protein
MPVIYTNNASTTLSSGINDSTTTIPIASASGFPSIGGGEYFYGTISNTNNTKIEVVKVTAGTTSLTVLRAQDNTTAQAFDSGDNFQVRVTAATLSAATITDVNITGGAIAGAAITNDVIDSQHYADGSIDHAHLANDCIDGDNIQDDVLDSEHYAAASIDLEHMSSESVDEDNLYISNAGSNGQFLSKQSGNNGGLTWATVSSEDYIPDGSVMVFFQAAAPTGWTKLATQNDKTLRVVSGDGGGTGGDWAMSSGETTSSNGAHTHTSAAHTHTGAAHTHTGGSLAAGAHTLSTSEMPSHTHVLGNWDGGGPYHTFRRSGGHEGTSGASGATGGGGSHSHSLSGTSASTTPGASGSTTPADTGSAGAHTHTIAAPQYIDVIICSKDA